MFPHLMKIRREVDAGIGSGTAKAARRGRCPPIMGRRPLPSIYLRIFGVTKDSAGAVLGGCTVHLFRTSDDIEIDETTSDGSGNYEFRSPSLTTTYYVVAYKAGAPDVAGTTVNTLLGA